MFFRGNFRLSGGHPSSAASHCDTHLSGEIFGPQVFEAAGLSSQQVRLEAMNIDRYITCYILVICTYIFFWWPTYMYTWKIHRSDVLDFFCGLSQKKTVDGEFPN